MSQSQDDLYREIKKMDSRLGDIQSELRIFMERSNREHLSRLVDDLRHNVSTAISRHLLIEIQQGLERGMVRECPMRETCHTLLAELLQRNASLMKIEEVSKTQIEIDVDSLRDMQQKAPYPHCEICFSEAQRLLDHQIELLRSLRIYREEAGPELGELPEDRVVQEILDPLGHRLRLQILKSLVLQSRSFSYLSDLTGLRGGNLLFHLSKLLEGGMVLQQHERGDYMLTEKGLRCLKALSDLFYPSIQEPEEVGDKSEKLGPRLEAAG